MTAIIQAHRTLRLGQFHLIWAATAAAILVHGPGAISLDALIGKTLAGGSRCRPLPKRLVFDYGARRRAPRTFKSRPFLESRPCRITPFRISTTSPDCRKSASAPRNSCASARCRPSITPTSISTWGLNRRSSAPIARHSLYLRRRPSRPRPDPPNGARAGGLIPGRHGSARRRRTKVTSRGPFVIAGARGAVPTAALARGADRPPHPAVRAGLGLSRGRRRPAAFAQRLPDPAQARRARRPDQELAVRARYVRLRRGADSRSRACAAR